MATTGFWPVKGQLKQVLDYADNPKKTASKAAGDDLLQTLRYTANEEKTEQRLFVSALNTSPSQAYADMMATKKRFGKTGGNVAYHGYQSFRTGEVTPEEAHQIGLETARRMWGRDYEVLIATHLNTVHRIKSNCTFHFHPLYWIVSNSRSPQMNQAAQIIEDIILQHSRRGMTQIRDALPDGYCGLAADAILSWPRGTVLLTTGFYVGGFAETDGPLGSFVLSHALKELGFAPVIVTDEYCRGYFEPEGLPVRYLPLDADDAAAESLLVELSPVGLISIERCGRNARGKYANMRGIDIGQGTAPCDALFLAAYGKIPTIGVGDGGNEIGMGNVADVIAERLSLTPSVIKTDILVIATVSNWGAYGIAAALANITGQPLLINREKAQKFLLRTVSMGCVDGISHEHVAMVDGFELETELGILKSLLKMTGE